MVGAFVAPCLGKSVKFFMELAVLWSMEQANSCVFHGFRTSVEQGADQFVVMNQFALDCTFKASMPPLRCISSCSTACVRFWRWDGKGFTVLYLYSFNRTTAPHLSAISSCSDSWLSFLTVAAATAAVAAQFSLIADRKNKSVSPLP